MALWYVDTTAGGGNDGTTKADAWTNIRSAIEEAGLSAGDTIYVRANQTHTITDASLSPVVGGTADNPITIIGDTAALNIWGDGSDVKPIIDFNATTRYLALGGGDVHWYHQGLSFTNSDNAVGTVYLTTAVGVKFTDCAFSDGGTTPTRLLYVTNGGDGVLVDCTFGGGGNTAYCVEAANGGHVRLSGSTVDGGGVGVKAAEGGRCVLENCTLGNTTENAVADLTISRAGVIVGMGNSLNSTTETTFGAVHPWEQDGGYIALGDYGSTKGAWLKEGISALLESLAATSTSAGRRTGGAATVIKVSPKSTVTDDKPTLVAEWTRKVTNTGTPYVDVWTQPDNTWAAVPDTEGSDAEIYVEVLAWDAATSQYIWHDSRDEASQQTQVEGAWRRIRVSNVAVDASGTIIVRVWSFAYEASKFFHVDRIVDVSGELAPIEPPFVLDDALLLQPSNILSSNGSHITGIVQGPQITGTIGQE
jgi:hypothetical protein